MDSLEAYLPHINAAEGIKRIMNNKKLYVTMLGRFKLRQMTETLLAAIENGTPEEIAFAAHAIKGTSGNLGFPTLYKLSGEIENLAKEKKDVQHLTVPFKDLVSEVTPVIQDFIEKEG